MLVGTTWKGYRVSNWGLANKKPLITVSPSRDTLTNGLSAYSIPFFDGEFLIEMNLQIKYSTNLAMQQYALWKTL